jgi:hypothetical protein
MKLKSILLTAVATLGLTAATMAQVPNYVPTNGLVGWWPFNGNANDVSGNGNNGTVNGATLTTDRFGNSNSAYSFDGNTNCIATSSQICSDLNTNEVTVSMWSYSNVIQAQSLFEEIPNNPNYRINAHINYTQLGATFWDYGNLSSGGRITGIDNSSQLNQWDHYIFTASMANNSMKVYKNGTIILQGNYTSGYSSIGDISFGGNPSYFAGKIDDIGIWNRALNQQEITALYNGGTVGLNDLHQPVSFSVYPNPAQNIINIKVNPEDLGLPIKLFDIYGKLALSKTIDQKDFNLDLTNLANGIYLLRFDDYKGFNFKIVKQ